MKQVVLGGILGVSLAVLSLAVVAAVAASQGYALFYNDNGLRARLGRLETQLSAPDDEGQALLGRVAALETAVSSVTRDVGSLKTETASIITEVDSRLGDLSFRISLLEPLVGKHEERLSTLEVTAQGRTATPTAAPVVVNTRQTATPLPENPSVVEFDSCAVIRIENTTQDICKKFVFTEGEDGSLNLAIPRQRSLWECWQTIRIADPLPTCWR